MSSVILTQISTNTDLAVTLGDISSDGKVISYITKPTTNGGESTLYIKKTADGSITKITEFTVGDPATTGIDGGALSSDGAFITYSVGALNGGVVSGVLNTIYFNETADPTPDENLIPIASALNEGFLPAEISGLYTLYGRNVTTTDDNLDEDSAIVRLNTNPFTKLDAAGFRDASEAGAAGLLITPLDQSFDGRFTLVQSVLPLDGQETDRDMDLFLVASGPGGFTTRVGQNATSSDNGMAVNGQFIAYTMRDFQSPFDQVFVQIRSTPGIVTDTVVSTNAAGERGNGHSFVTSLSDDGRFVAFISEANNLVIGDTNEARDLFVKNLQTGEVIRVASAGTAANPTILDGELSADGLRIAFTTTDQLGSDDHDTLPDVYVADLTFSTNRPPTAANDGYSLNEDTALTIAAPGVLGNDSDPDSDPLSAVIVNSASRGTVVLNANGSFTYTPIPNFHGLDSFTYKVSDGKAESTVATVSITVNSVEDKPVAQADSYSTNEDTPLIIAARGVLANDSDGDGDSLSAVLDTGPGHGSLVLTANGSFTYTPNANYVGPDSFSYKANDGKADSNITTVFLTVAAVNDAPQVTNDFFVMNEDNVFTISAPGVLNNDTDAEGDTLTAALVSGPSNGSLNLNSDGSFSYTPDPNYFGADSFSYKANDGKADSGIATVFIAIEGVNDRPVGASDFASVVEDASVLVDVLANDFDVEDVDLTILLSGSTSKLGASIEIVDGKIRYTADADRFDLAGFTGAIDEFTYIARDSGGLATDPITVFVGVAPANDQRTVNGTKKPNNFTDDLGFDTTYFGENGKDVIHGRDGSDTLHGQDGDDQLFGGPGIDFLFGGKGKDILDGEDGNDVIAGGEGNDLLRGGGGSDTFAFEKKAGDDTIVDFLVGVDHLQLNGGMTIHSVRTVDVDHTGGLDTVVSFGKGGGTVALLGVNGISDWNSLL